LSRLFFLLKNKGFTGIDNLLHDSKNRTDFWNFSFDTFDGAKPRFLNRGRKRRSVSTLSIPRASDRGVEWVDFLPISKERRRMVGGYFG
jgi:hypothetical protein